MRINYKKLYESRLEEIEVQIKQCIQKRNWRKKSSLDTEKKELLEKIKKYNQFFFNMYHLRNTRK